jgi:hypothetical protein
MVRPRPVTSRTTWSGGTNAGLEDSGLQLLHQWSKTVVVFGSSEINRLPRGKGTIAGLTFVQIARSL